MNNKPDHRVLINQCGFTLIELLIAIAIFSLGFMAAGAMQTKALKDVRSSQDKTEAMQALNRQVDILKQTPLYSTDIWNWTGAGPAFIMTPMFVDQGKSPDFFVVDGDYQVSWWINTPHYVVNRWTSAVGNILLSEDITATVARNGDDPDADALLRVEFLKTWATQH